MTIQYDSTGNDFTPCVLREVKKGELITRKANTNTVYIKGDYDRASKKFSLIDFNDSNREIFIKADATVFVGFTY